MVFRVFALTALLALVGVATEPGLGHGDPARAPHGQANMSAQKKQDDMTRAILEQWKKVAIAVQNWSKEREERTEFILRGLEAPQGPPILDPAIAREFLEPFPRFQDHRYYSVAFQKELDGATSSRLTAGNKVKLLPNYHSWEAKRALMTQARETLYATTMVYHCDEGGQAFAQGMIDAARRGVDTRLIVDGIYIAAAQPCLRRMREAGVKIRVSLRSLRPDKLDWEMHEKLFIVDARIGITGGQNVGKKYQEASGVDANYRDTDIRLEGPVVRDMARRFVRLWHMIDPDDTSLDAYTQQIVALDETDARHGLVGQIHYAAWLAPGHRRGLCRFVAQDPQLGTFHVWTLYQRYVEAAQKRVMLTSYNLDPNGSPTQEALRDALIALSERPGAIVDIITNGPWFGSSVTVPPWLARARSASILARSWEGFQNTPVRIWTYHYFTHAKQYYFDGVAAGIGSFNFDASGNRCQESVVVVIDPDLVSEVETLFALDLANATLVTPVETTSAYDEAVSETAGGGAQ